MQNTYASRLSSRTSQWAGRGVQFGDRHHQHARKLNFLYQALEFGELDAARLLFVDLVNFEPAVANEPCMSQLGAELQSSNLKRAMHFAQELKAKASPMLRGAAAQSFLQGPSKLAVA